MRTRRDTVSLTPLSLAGLLLGSMIYGMVLTFLFQVLNPDPATRYPHPLIATEGGAQ